MLKSLNVLVAAQNRIACVHDLSTPSLLHIDLSHNHLTSLPNLPMTMTKLIVNNNGLDSLPSLPLSLNTVDASNNRISRLSPLPRKLTMCNLSNNNIQNLTGLMQSAFCLMSLNLRDNQIKVLPASMFHEATELVSLDVANNDLGELPCIVGYLPKLKKLLLEGNRLRQRSLGGSVEAIKKSLRFRGGPGVVNDKFLTEDGGEEEAKAEDETHNTRVARDAVGGDAHLNLDEKNLVSLPARVLEELEFRGDTVKSFTCANNRLTRVSEDWFGVLTHLTAVDFSKNGLATIPQNIADLDNLLSLSLAHNPLRAEALTPLFPRDGNLMFTITHLDLSGCRLTHLPVELFEFRAVRELLLGFNGLTTLSGRGGWVVGGGLGDLSTLDLSNNKLTDTGVLAVDARHKPNLRTLLLGNNELGSIDVRFGECTGLRSVDFRGNPQRAVRPAILEKGAGEIMAYLRSKGGMGEGGGEGSSSGGGGGMGDGGGSMGGNVQGVLANRVNNGGGGGGGGGGGVGGGDAEMMAIQSKIDELLISMNHVHNTEAKKYALKKQIAIHKSALIKLNRQKERERGEQGARVAAFKTSFD